MTAQEILLQRYGDPFDPAFQSTFMNLWRIQQDFAWFPTRNVFIHRDFQALLHQAFSNLEQNNLHQEIHTFDGVFNQRTVIGSLKTLSLHAWGCAIDLNAIDNPLGSQGNWSQPFIETMLQSGVFCGNFFQKRPDPMHFGLLNG